jgi:hypothetical protein
VFTLKTLSEAMSLPFLKGNTMYYFDKFQEHMNDTAPCSSRWDGYDRGDTRDFAYDVVEDWFTNFENASTWAKRQAKTYNKAYKVIRSGKWFVVDPL